MENMADTKNSNIMSENKFTIENLLSSLGHGNELSNEMSNGIDLSNFVARMNNSASEHQKNRETGAFKNNTHQLEILQSPWIETSINEVEPRFYTPKSFKNINVKFTNKDKKGVPDNRIDDVSEATSKLTQHYNDETLFYLFYKHPGTVIQELTYLQLRTRNWRYHKVLKMWLTKLPNIEPMMFPDNSGERGVYYFWDYINWCKEEKEFELLYSTIM
ncbi:hypothetical protein QEN19_003265 [Hanseniaspora menglaensis]